MIYDRRMSFQLTITNTDTGRFEVVDVNQFPSSEPFVHIPSKTFIDANGSEARGLTIEARGFSPSGWFALLSALDMAQAAGVERIELIVPFFPGARQDRRDDTPLSVQVFAQTLTPYPIHSITVLDPHSDVTAAVLPARVRIISAADAVTSAIELGLLQHPDGVIAPDTGATKRAGCVARRLGVPLRQGHKHRDPSTGSLSSFGVDGGQPGRWLVVDDICDGGGTFAGLADAFYASETNSDSSLDLFVSHGLFSKGLDALSAYETVVSTDSLPAAIRSVPTVPLSQLTSRPGSTLTEPTPTKEANDV